MSIKQTLSNDGHTYSDTIDVMAEKIARSAIVLAKEGHEVNYRQMLDVLHELIGNESIALLSRLVEQSITKR